jgi:hypothetical protein
MKIKQIMAAPEQITVCFHDVESDGAILRVDCPVIALEKGDPDDEESQDYIIPLIFMPLEGIYRKPEENPFFLGYEINGKKQDWSEEIKELTQCEEN